MLTGNDQVGTDAARLAKRRPHGMPVSRPDTQPRAVQTYFGSRAANARKGPCFLPEQGRTDDVLRHIRPSQRSDPVRVDGMKDMQSTDACHSGCKPEGGIRRDREVDRYQDLPVRPFCRCLDHQHRAPAKSRCPINRPSDDQSWESAMAAPAENQQIELLRRQQQVFERVSDHHFDGHFDVVPASDLHGKTAQRLPRLRSLKIGADCRCEPVAH